MDQTIDTLVEIIQTNHEVADIPLIRKAYEFAERMHTGMTRKTGEPYITHPMSVATILATHGFCSTNTICAALLHDVIEDCDCTPQQIETLFGKEIVSIVNALTKLTEQEVGFENIKAENLRKIILATAKDVRVMLIKIADRIHNMQTISTFREEKQRRIADETLEVYAPMAEKIGLYQFKAILEDASFAVIEPQLFEFVKNKVNATEDERRSNTEEIIIEVVTRLDANKIRHIITGRAKHYYSIYKKMRDENKTFDQIYDIYGVRIIVPTKQDCYKTITILRDAFKELPDRYKDYVKDPKPNGYQSIHANFFFKDKVIEVQVRSKEMDDQAESGLASHWKYKGTERDKRFERKLAWLRQILTWRQRNTKNTQDIGMDLFKNEIITITPKGDPVILPEKASPIDFAYMIHSSIGDRARAARVNGKIVPLDHELTSGDIIQIEVASSNTVNESWLKFVRSPNSISRIRKALGIESDNSSKKERAKKQKYQDMSNMFRTIAQLKEVVKKTPIKLSQCCNPTSETPIVAYFTKDKRMITVHRINCPNQHALDPKNRVTLKVTPIKSPVATFDVLMEERPGLLVMVLNALLAESYRIRDVESSESHEANLVTIHVGRREDNALNETLGRIRGIPGVIDARLGL